ncbi:MAG: hypothetical protein LBC18_14035, partial [Opitutaceae bacterium]|nr:hypothetical protein [Opitutaceae bacterium]
AEFDLNGTRYRYNGNDVTGTANADWKYTGPYVGMGWDIGIFSGLSFFMDAGVVFAGESPKLGLNVPINDKLQRWDRDTSTWQNVGGNTDLETKFNEHKDAALADAQDELNKYKIYPLIKLGLMWRF